VPTPLIEVKMFDKLLTPEEAIAYLRLDAQELRQPRESLRWLCRTGKLRYAKIGRYVRFRRTWLDELVDRQVMRPTQVNEA
jgi:helix-turn-helix protein